MADEGLPDELRELGRRLRVPDVDGESMAERVLAQLLAERVPTPVPRVEQERIIVWTPARGRSPPISSSGPPA